MKRRWNLKSRIVATKISTGTFVLTASLAISTVAIWTKTNESHMPNINVVAASKVEPTATPSTSPPRASKPITPITYDVGPYSPPLSCGLWKINPAEYKPEIQWGVCIAGWMFTWSDNCIDCEGLRIWHASEGFWTEDDFYGGYLYTYCFSYDNDQFGTSPESDIYYSLQLIFTDKGCNDEPLDYRKEPADGPLKFGDIGNRVKALQKALIEKVYMVEAGVLGKADGIYGPLTTRAVMNFQYMSGLPTNGIADQRTFAELGLTFSYEKN